jgi:hypothetical protein
MIAIDEKVTNEVKAEFAYERLLRDDFSDALARLSADVHPEILADIQEGQLTALQHHEVDEYMALGMKEHLGVSLYMARFAPRDSDMSKNACASLMMLLDRSYEKTPEIAAIFTDCVLDYLWPITQVRKKILNHVYEQDKTLWGSPRNLSGPSASRDI